MEASVDGYVLRSGEMTDEEIEALYGGYVDRATVTMRLDPSYAVDIASGLIRKVRRRI
jgi:hypothetical protein